MRVARVRVLLPDVLEKDVSRLDLLVQERLEVGLHQGLPFVLLARLELEDSHRGVSRLGAGCASAVDRRHEHVIVVSCHIPERGVGRPLGRTLLGLGELA